MQKDILKYIRKTFIEVPHFTKHVFTKNEKDNLSKEERNELKILVKLLREEYSKK